MIRRINVGGTSGVGKSTLTSWLFSHLKIIANNHNIDLKVEQVQEALKPDAWANKKVEGWDQWRVTVDQLMREYNLLRHGVDVIITDSPLWIYPYYAKRYDTPANELIRPLIAEFEEQFPSLNFLIQRGSKPYKKHGRFETVEESNAGHAGIRDFLDESEQDYIMLPFENRQSLLARSLLALGLDSALGAAYN